MTDPVLIAGGGIAGMTMALTCHEIGVPCIVLESVRALAPLGVGINLQPNAVRELDDLGLGDRLPDIGIEATEWALVGRNGNDVWSEPRGRLAGYRWPQWAVHRGKLQMMLYDAVVARLGPEVVRTDHRVIGYENGAGGTSALVEHRDGSTSRLEGSVLIGADGLHSMTRRQMYPNEGAPIWGGAVLWRCTALGEPLRSGSAFTLVGGMSQRFIHYPISPPDPTTGLQLQNLIAELTFDPSEGWSDSDWVREANVDDFLPAFEDWNFDWLDIPAMIRQADAVYEYPMVDRDPVESWVDGTMCLIGDAAHVMYPVGSNGASQAIVDARVLGASFVEHGVGQGALHAFEDQLLEPMNSLVLRNRGAGPIGILGIVEERCGGVFDDIADVIPPTEIEEYMATYKAAAGFAIDALNAAPRTIASGATM